MAPQLALRLPQSPRGGTSEVVPTSSPGHSPPKLQLSPSKLQLSPLDDHAPRQLSVLSPRRPPPSQLQNLPPIPESLTSQQLANAELEALDSASFTSLAAQLVKLCDALQVQGRMAASGSQPAAAAAASAAAAQNGFVPVGSDTRLPLTSWDDPNANSPANTRAGEATPREQLGLARLKRSQRVVGDDTPAFFGQPIPPSWFDRPYEAIAATFRAYE